MFTGLIEGVGAVTRLATAPGGYELAIRTPLAMQLATGDSIAVNGVCLTVAAVEDREMVAQIGPETARITNIGRLRAGMMVNLERPVRADARMGGHFVLGHVDGTGRIVQLTTEGEFRWVSVRYPAALGALVILKGSIAVDGISLTVARLTPGHFDVQIVPFTWEQTNLRTRGPGDEVNLECDVLGKYVLRALEVRKIDV
ncbi:MAG: riboflavin synthase [Acidobacteria bacterium]|nr:riboflavin synthase [Acidobacteriota bacterium]